MKARLGFAIAYHIDSDVMLLDETLAPGDHAFRRKASDLIKDKIRSNKTVIMVMHAMPVIEELCDRVIQIEEGLSLPERSIEESVEDYLSRRPLGRNGREPEPHPVRTK
jgi:lipopolysaccharide transport system ATP-binding protein